WNTRFVEVHRAPPVLHGNNRQIGIDAAEFVEEPGELADGHAVPEWNRELADEGLEPLHQHGSVNPDPADRVGPVADDDRDAVLFARPQAVRHRVDERVDARPHILEIDDEHVEVLEHLRRRLAGVAVQRVHRNAPRGVAGMRGFDHVVLDVRAEAVLRAEDRAKANIAARLEARDDVLKAGVHGSGIRYDSHPLAFQFVRRQQPFRAQSDAHDRHYIFAARRAALFETMTTTKGTAVTRKTDSQRAST